MSTKCTIGHGNTYHLYEECFDSDQVWLQLDGHDFDVNVEMGTGNRRPSLTVGIDVGIWREIVEAWLKSNWGKHPERDYEREEVSLDGLKALVELRAKKTEELATESNVIEIVYIPLPSGKVLKAKEPLRLKVDRIESLYRAYYPQLSIFSTGQSMDQLREEVLQDIRTVWKHYVMVSPEELTKDALDYAEQLKSKFEEQDE